MPSEGLVVDTTLVKPQVEIVFGMVSAVAPQLGISKLILWPQLGISTVV